MPALSGVEGSKDLGVLGGEAPWKKTFQGGRVGKSTQEKRGRRSPFILSLSKDLSGVEGSKGRRTHSPPLVVRQAHHERPIHSNRREPTRPRGERVQQA